MARNSAMTWPRSSSVRTITRRMSSSDRLLRRGDHRFSLLDWLRRHDPGYTALRRAVRTALIMPAMFALGDKVIGNAAVATFAAFGAFAMLLLVDFTGPMRQRLQAQAALAVICCLLIALGTLASR